MSLLFFDGCSDAGLVLPPEWALTSSTLNGQTGRSGDANGALGSATFSVRTLTLPTPAATFIMGYGFKAAAVGLSGTGDCVFGIQVAGTTRLAIWPNASGLLEARLTSNTGTLLATATGSPLSVNTWAHIQIKVVMHATAGSIVIKINGVTVMNYTGQTSTVTGSVSGIYISNGNLANSWIWDDIWICDGVDATATEGRANNDFLGDLKVAQLLPSAAGDTTQWTPSTGANYAAVDEAPPNTTDYVSSPTSAQRDLYALADLPANTGLVYGLRVGTYAAKSDAGAVSVKPVIKESGGTVTTDPAVSVASTTYGPLYGTFRKVKPSNSAVWAAADVNALQAGVEVA